MYDRRLVGMVNGLIGYLESFSFHLRWIVMSPQEKYSYLWARTKKLGNLGYDVRNTAVNINK